MYSHMGISSWTYGKAKKIQSAAEIKLIEVLAKYGPSHMYPFHEKPSSKNYVAARSTLDRAKKNLLNPPEFIYLKETKEVNGVNRLIFALTFRGLHFALINGLADFKKVKKITQEHEIKIPQITEADLEEYLKVISSRSSPFGAFLRPLLATMGTERVKNCIKIAIEKYPQELFKNSLTGGLLDSAIIHLDPLWDRKKYLKSLVVKAVYVIFENYRFVETRSEMIDIIGEDAFEIVRLMHKELEKLTLKESTFLNHIPRERRNEILNKLKKTRE